MLLEVYIEELEESLATNPQKEEIIKDIKAKIALYQEATLTEEEILKRLPKIDELVYKNEDINGDFDLEISVTSCNNIYIEKKMISGVIISNYEDIKDRIDVNQSKDKLFIKEKKKSFLFRHKEKYDLYIAVGQDLNILSVKGISSDLDITRISVSNVKINLISGDLEINNSKFKKVEFANVSGDIEIKDVNIDNGNISTVSGDVTIDNLNVVNMINVNTISGDLEVKNIDQNKFNFHTVSGGFLNK